MIGFNGLVHEPGTRWQLLGNGRRVFNPVLMRFHSPDDLSPFGRAGINAYAYCNGDPVNQFDPSGQTPLAIAAAASFAAKAKAAGAGLGVAGANAWSNRLKVGGVQSGTSWAQRVSSAAAATVTPAPTLAVLSAGPPARRPVPVSAGSSTQKSAPIRAYGPDGVSVGDPLLFNSIAWPPQGYKPVKPRTWKDPQGQNNVSMSDLDPYVRARILQVRKLAPGGSAPARTRDWLGKRFANPGNRVPTGHLANYLHTYPIYLDKGHGFESWRLIVGGTMQKIDDIRLTWDHYKTNVIVPDWKTYNAPR